MDSEVTEGSWASGSPEGVLRAFGLLPLEPGKVPPMALRGGEKVSGEGG